VARPDPGLYAPARGGRADTERRIWQGIGEAHGRGRADLSWLDQAACLEVGTEFHFPEKGGSAREAKLLCRGCEVRERCLEYALEHSEAGIWGGMSERERRRLKRGAA